MRIIDRNLSRVATLLSRTKPGSWYVSRKKIRAHGFQRLIAKTSRQRVLIGKPMVDLDLRIVYSFLVRALREVVVPVDVVVVTARIEETSSR